MMRSKLFYILFLLSIIFLFSINCQCPSGYFTKTNPCDTKATLLSSTRYTDTNIGSGQWHYYYLPLAGISDDFGLSFQVETPYLEAFMDFQQAGGYQLPDDSNFDFAFYVEDGDRDIPFQVLTYGMQNINRGNMLLGIYNPYTSDVNVQIEYYTSGGDNFKATLNRIIVGIIIIVFAIVFTFSCLGLVINRLVKRRRAALRRANARLEPDTQGILILQAQPDQNNLKSTNALTLEEFQKYFPLKPFEKLENKFQQTGCSVCLEDFSTETLCHQLYCNHIFHEGCIQKWLEKQNSCPACRVPLGKRAIEEFLEAQKKQGEVNLPEAIEIKIQDQEVANE